MWWESTGEGRETETDQVCDAPRDEYTIMTTRSNPGTCARTSKRRKVWSWDNTEHWDEKLQVEGGRSSRDGDGARPTAPNRKCVWNWQMGLVEGRMLGTVTVVHVLLECQG